MRRTYPTSGQEAVAMSGTSLTDGPLADILRTLAAAAGTGGLHVRRVDSADAGPDADGVAAPEAVLYLRDGALYAATAPGPRPLLGVRLVSAGAVTREALEEALESQAGELAGWRLGELLVHLGYVEADVVNDFVVEQLLDTVSQVAAWPAGGWRFRRGERTREADGRALPVEELLAEIGRRRRRWLELQNIIGSADTVPSRVSFDAGAVASMTPIARTLLTEIDGVRTMSELAVRCGLTTYEAGLAIAPLVSSGVVEVDATTIAMSAEQHLGVPVQLSHEPAMVSAPAAPVVADDGRAAAGNYQRRGADPTTDNEARSNSRAAFAAELAAASAEAEAVRRAQEAMSSGKPGRSGNDHANGANAGDAQVIDLAAARDARGSEPTSDGAGRHGGRPGDGYTENVGGTYVDNFVDDFTGDFPDSAAPAEPAHRLSAAPAPVDDDDSEIGSELGSEFGADSPGLLSTASVVPAVSGPTHEATVADYSAVLADNADGAAAHDFISEPTAAQPHFALSTGPLPADEDSVPQAAESDSESVEFILTDVSAPDVDAASLLSAAAAEAEAVVPDAPDQHADNQIVDVVDDELAALLAGGGDLAVELAEMARQVEEARWSAENELHAQLRAEEEAALREPRVVDLVPPAIAEPLTPAQVAPPAVSAVEPVAELAPVQTPEIPLTPIAQPPTPVAAVETVSDPSSAAALARDAARIAVEPLRGRRAPVTPAVEPAATKRAPIGVEPLAPRRPRVELPVPPEPLAPAAAAPQFAPVVAPLPQIPPVAPLDQRPVPAPAAAPASMPAAAALAAALANPGVFVPDLMDPIAPVPPVAAAAHPVTAAPVAFTPAPTTQVPTPAPALPARGASPALEHRVPGAGTSHIGSGPVIPEPTDRAAIHAALAEVAAHTAAAEAQEAPPAVASVPLAPYAPQQSYVSQQTFVDTTDESPDSPVTDTASLLRELSSLGMEDVPSEPNPAAAALRPPMARPGNTLPAESKGKRKGLFGR